MEPILFSALLAVAFLPVLATLWRARGLVAVAAIFALVVPAAFAWSNRKEESVRERLAPDARPIEVEDAGYISSRACRSCHPREHASWHASYHRSMTQIATPQAVAGDFSGVELELHGRTYRLERRGETYWELDRKGLEPWRERRLVMTTGSHHYQLYWRTTDQGRLVRPLPFAFLIDEQRWIPRRSVFLGPVEKTAFILGDWNQGCIRCHSTHGRARIDARGNVDSHVGEFGIACESCHGPAEQHVIGNQAPWRRYRHLLTDDSDASIVNPKRLSPRRSSQVCGQCHGILSTYSDQGKLEDYVKGPAYRPGDELTATRLIDSYQSRDHPRMRETLAEDPHYLDFRFWSDGMVRVSGREYNGLIETPCHERGEMSCLSCHSMHISADDPRSVKEWADDQLKPGMDGDLACIQCHETYATNPREHTRHAPESSGSRCYNCHMPHTTYGLLKAIRSHQVDSPSVATSLATGRPNACNLCHLDRSLGWTAEHLARWYGTPIPELSEDEKTTSAALLWLLTGDAGQRALIAWSMGWQTARESSGEDWLPPFLALLLNDPYEAVRFIARRSLRRLPGFEEFDYDFIGDPGERLEARARAIEIWSRMGEGEAGGRRHGEEVLIDSRGGLRMDAIGALLKRRNNRPLELHE